MYVIQSKNGTMINVDVNLKNWFIGVIVKKFTYEILVSVIVSVKKHVKLVNI